MAVLLCMDGLKHKQSLSEVPATLLGNSLVQPIYLLPTLLLSNNPQHAAYLLFSRCCNPDQQRSTPNWSNDVTRRVRQQDQPQVRTIFLHGPSQRCLRIARQMIRLIDDHDLETLFGVQINLLRLCDFLEKILHNNTVVVSDV